MSAIFDRPWVTGIGMCTPIGMDTPTVQLEVAAGTAHFEELPVNDRRGEPVRGSALSFIEAADRTTRMATMAQMAAAEALQRAAQVEPLRADVPVFVGLPEDDGVAIDAEALRSAIGRAAPDGPVLRFGPTWACRQGRAGFFFALHHALALLDARSVELVLVGAVDSLCDPGSLGRLVGEGRIQGDAIDGLLPGEGAGFIVLARADPGRRRAPGAFTVLGTALSQEPNDYYGDEPNLSGGLSAAFRSLRQHPAVGERHCERLLNCQTGESHWNKELGAAYLRNGPLMPEPFTYDFVAESFGACGAASGALAMGLGQRLLAGFGGEQPRVLAYGSSDRGHIGACVVAGQPQLADLGSLAVAHVASAGARYVPRVPDEARAFERDRHEGHLDDISGLLDERRFDLETGARSWVELAQLEQRIEGHVRAMIAGGEDAFALAREAADDADEDVEAGALRLLGSPGALPMDLEALREAMAAIPAEGWRWALVSDAIRLGEHRQLDTALGEMILDDELSPEIRGAVVEVVGRRRGLATATMLPVLEAEDTPPVLRSQLGLALARAGTKAALRSLLTLAQSDREDPVVLEALLRLGWAPALDVARWFLQQPEPPPAMVRLVGLAGDASDVVPLHGLLARPSLEPALALAGCEALGCLGRADSIPRLLDAWTAAGESLDVAALALDRITGARLRDDEVPEGIEEEDDDGGEDEGEEEDDDERIDASPGSPSWALLYSCTDPERWRAWWATHQARFDPSSQYRGGQPLTLAQCLAELEHDGDTPLRTRSLGADELAIRLRTASPFEADAPVAAQRQGLSIWRGALPVR